MTAHDPKFARESRGILRWFGFSSSNSEPSPHDPQGDHGSPGNGDWRDRRRRELLNDITSFLLTHRLEVNARSLAIGHDFITGANPRLARLIEERVAQREPLTIEWLDDASRRCGNRDESAAVNTLMATLETSIEEFGKTTSAARCATTEYNSALKEQVGELERVDGTGSVISELATIARVMLERTNRIEVEMARSEKQTQALQASLDRARRDAEMDHLTGLPNRRAFEAALETEIAIAARNRDPVCVAFCDIDHFKKINDTHGHDAGDRVLRTVAKTLATISNDRCHVARHGGEEFVVLFRGDDIEQAWRALDDARETMASRRLVNRATDILFGQITFSAGIANLSDYENPREALKAADEALYTAKNRGRNQVLKAWDLEAAELT